MRGLALGKGVASSQPAAAGARKPPKGGGGRSRMAPSTMLLSLAAGDAQLARAAEVAGSGAGNNGSVIPGRRSEAPARYKITEVRQRQWQLHDNAIGSGMAMPVVMAGAWRGQWLR